MKQLVQFGRLWLAAYGRRWWYIHGRLLTPKPAMHTLAWAKGLWCPSERRYIRAIDMVVLLACWNSIRIPLGFRLWCPKEQAGGLAPAGS